MRYEATKCVTFVALIQNNITSARA